MIDRRFLAETTALVLAALVCATGANLLASRERTLPIVGDYPHARVVPAASTPTAPVAAPATSPEALPASPAAGTTAPVASPATGPGPAPGTKEPAPAATPRPGVPRPEGPAAVPAPGATTDVLARFPPHPDRPFREISGEDAAWLHGNGALFLDARRTKAFEEGHVAGARAFSVWESDVGDKIFALVNEGRAPDQPVVAYCSGGDCEDSHMLSEKLFGAGFTNVLVYKDGWPDWQARGGPARTGPLP